mmetsp:Transcript_56070/g.100809  ORF Transcript_56070/g.100809 Transcript_56070/m.100809 type:complete len:228 (-) Transcript_56070:13-696(-)
MCVEGWWIAARTLTLPLVHKLRRLAMTWSAMVESRPLVGSSHSSSRGSPSSSRAMHSRFRSPPEIRALAPDSPMTESAILPRRRLSMTCSTAAAASRVPIPKRSSARKSNDCRTVSCGMTTSSCSTKPMSCRSCGPKRAPSKRTSPSCAMFCRRQLRKEVLPEPEGPMSATMRPGLSSPEHGDRICFSPMDTLKLRHSTSIAEEETKRTFCTNPPTRRMTLMLEPKK